MLLWPPLGVALFYVAAKFFPYMATKDEWLANSRNRPTRGVEAQLPEQDASFDVIRFESFRVHHFP
jgi:hypothetical protein